jgi:uncharacterized protein (DUF2147 family)
MTASNSPAFPGYHVPMASRRAPALLVMFAALAVPHAGIADPSPPVPPVISQTQGDWLTEDHRGVVHIGPCGNVICGTIIAQSDFRPDGSSMLDPSGHPQCHLAIIRSMIPGDDGRLHGTVTDPRDGSTYNAQLWLGDDGALRLRGYVAVPLLGSTQRWEHYAGTVTPDCHFPKK